MCRRRYFGATTDRGSSGRRATTSGGPRDLALPLTSCHQQGLWKLVLLCSHHHHLLQTPRWHTKLLPDTTLEITDPNGHTRTSHPPPLRE
jgi:hypothetical protein